VVLTTWYIVILQYSRDCPYCICYLSILRRGRQLPGQPRARNTSKRRANIGRGLPVLSHVELPRDSLIGSTAPHRHISMPLNPAHRGPEAKVTANIRDPHCHQNQDHRLDLQIRSTSEAAIRFQETSAYLLFMGSPMLCCIKDCCTGNVTPSVFCPVLDYGVGPLWSPRLPLKLDVRPHDCWGVWPDGKSPHRQRELEEWGS
jgi:hypothetical protein